MTSLRTVARSRRGTANLVLTEPAADAFEFLGRPWVSQVLFLLGQEDCRFSEVGAALPRVSGRVLTERLRELCAVGLALRCVDDDQPSRVTYRLTERGHSLVAVLQLVARWAETE